MPSEISGLRTRDFVGCGAMGLGIKAFRFRGLALKVLGLEIGIYGFTVQRLRCRICGVCTLQ